MFERKKILFPGDFNNISTGNGAGIGAYNM